MSIELHIHFTFLCLCAWVFYSGFISLFFMIQALKNIAAISLAINYPNKSTQLLNMSPWEQLTGRGNSLQELGGHAEEGGAHVSWFILTMQMSGNSQNSQCFDFTWIILCHHGQGTQEAPFTHSVLFALLVNTVYCVTEFTWTEQFWSLLFFFKFCFYLKNLGQRTVCQIHSS